MKTKNNQIAVMSICSVCQAKKSRFLSVEEAKRGGFLGLLGSLLGLGAAGRGLSLPGTAFRCLRLPVMVLLVEVRIR